MSVTADLSEIDLAEVEAVVGSRSFERGRAYVRRGHVLRVAWDGETLIGSVAGHGGLYNTTAFFDGGDGGELSLAEGECTCPVGYNCKHVAAIAIAAAQGRTVTRGPAGCPTAPAPEPEPPPWEQPLLALIEAPAEQGSGNPLAIELSLQASGVTGGGALRLIARLMRTGARGGWVNGSLSWTLDSWMVDRGGYRHDHAALARELSAVHRARDRRAHYYYGYNDKTLDLSDSSPQLWSALDEAARLRLPLIHAGKGLGELPPHRDGEVALDVTRQSGEGFLVRGVVRVDGANLEDLRPVLFLGSEGHGVVCADVSTGAELQSWRLQLLRLTRPVAPQLQHMILDDETIEIPADDLERFAAEICPSLRGVAPVVSSDRSFDPPEVSAPSLQLLVRYGERHELELGWAWSYQVGEQSLRTPLGLGASGPGFRDLDAEWTILRDTALGGRGLERFGLLDAGGRPADVLPVRLSGIDSMELTTDVLPALNEHGRVSVEVEGEPPDYRDVGDSLTIGLSTAEIAGERDWFGLGVTITLEGRELPFAEVFVALASGESHMLLDDGAHFSLLDPRLQSLRQLIEEARGLTDGPTGLRISPYQAGLWCELVALGIVGEQAEAWQRQVGGLLALEALPEHEPPATMTADLRPYQRRGFAWLAAIWELELGGILADDMGLGKTLQALALICHVRAQRPDGGPFLVVAPTSVVSGWASEAERFAPGLRVEALTDTLAKSGRAIGELTGADVVVTTYTLLRIEAEEYGAVLWSGVILDEAQYVKNHQAKTYRCVRELRAPFKLAVTGTPMENNLMELWALLSITAPGLFPDPKQFAEQYQRPIERGRDAHRLDRLRRRIKPLVKRRTKELVATELPVKQEQTLEVDLHPRHRKLYDTRLQRERQKILGLLGDFNRNRFTILRSITLLRQLSIHAGLVEDRHDDVPCAKLGVLVEHLSEVAHGGHRALVFSQFTRFLGRVRSKLDEHGVGYCYLDGETRGRKRVLDCWRAGADPVFLISLKAGGFGLNLTEADYVFLLDPWWNPAVESQAIDRTHRIGQTRPVMVYRMISRQTIEEKVVALARRKAALFHGVMDEGDMFAGAITAEDIRELLG